jgi:4-coumarate--CoA ligase
MTIITSTFTPLAFSPNLTIPELITKYNPDHVLPEKVVHEDTISGKTLTYGGLRLDAARCAWGLQQLGLQEGDVVCVIIPNSTDFVLLAHSVWWAGATFSPLNPSYTVNDIAHSLDLVKPTHVVVAGAYLQSVQNALWVSSLSKSGGRQPKILTVLDRVKGFSLFPEDVIGKTTEQAIPPYSLEGSAKSAKTAVAIICFSSGTTGKMKGVQLTHYNLVQNLLQYRTSIPYMANGTSSEVFFPPYCHIYGLSTVVLLGMWMGNFTLGIPAFDFETFCRQMARVRATWAHIVPPVALLLASSEIIEKYDLSSLRYIIVAAAPLKPALQTRLKARFPMATVLQGYGLSECSPGVTFQHSNDESSVGTVGRIFSGTEARLVDPATGQDVEQGQEGELWVRGPQVMLGYVGDEVATSNTFSGDWLRTGDIMKLDEKGNFWITDRLKEMIKYKGFQVAPSELEDLLLGHPEVVDAAVCAVYDNSQATEVPLAYVSLGPKHTEWIETKRASVLEEIRTWVDGKVAGYKKLRGGVHHLQELPKTNTGKILRKDLPAKLKEAREARL